MIGSDIHTSVYIITTKTMISDLETYLCCQLVVEFSVGIGAFVIGLSQISFFFSSYRHFPLLNADNPGLPLYGIYISQLVTNGPSYLGLAFVLLVENNPFPELVVFFSGLFTSNIHRYFLDFAYVLY